MAYAETTRVPISQTKNEIEKCVNKYGAENFGIMNKGAAIRIMFTINERNILFEMLPPDDAQGARSIWRSMAMTIKMKLESCERGIETFEEAFLAHIMSPSGHTYGQHLIPEIAINYKNKSVPLLPQF